MRKEFICILSIITLFFYYGSTAYAESEYVDECLEFPENCEEIIEPDAEPDNEEAELLGQENNSSSLLLEIIKFFFALLLVLALIYLFLYFLKKRQNAGGRLKTLEHVGGVSVGQNKSVQLVRFADRIYVIGVGDDVTLLQEIKDKALIEDILKDKDEQIPDFTVNSLFESIFKQKNNEQGKSDFANLFQKELSNLKESRKNMISRHKEDHNE